MGAHLTGRRRGPPSVTWRPGGHCLALCAGSERGHHPDAMGSVCGGAPSGGRDVPILSQSLPADPSNTGTHEIPINECLSLVIQGTVSEHPTVQGSE